MASAWLLLTVFLLLSAAYAHAFAFSSPEGFTLVRKILLAALPTFEPHTYQMDGICKVLDKVDLVAVTPTGSGKTGFLFLTIIVMSAIAANPSLCPTVAFPKDPAIVVVCPTNSIEQQMDHPAAGKNNATWPGVKRAATSDGKVTWMSTLPINHCPIGVGNCRTSTDGKRCANAIRP
ncbi:hypothetical protein B0H10DRAFT_1977617 [Mycena sp. CBHHK59/15]|nr:hypothetical protein B0H10DRAFT_2006703 [Mycena sp. CBHHK59/15]KAJ6632514.1 hypothetical protein B0H10DRAFT_1977617 [Mycena sp. CBHHK59/15]